MNNPYFVAIVGFILMSFSAGWMCLSTVLGIPHMSWVVAIGVIMFGIGLGIVIMILSKLKSIKVDIIDE